MTTRRFELEKIARSVLAGLAVAVALMPAGARAQSYEWVSAAGPPANAVTAPDSSRAVCRGNSSNTLYQPPMPMGLLVGYWDGFHCITTSSAGDASIVMPQSPYPYPGEPPGNPPNAPANLQFLVVVSGSQNWVSGSPKVRPQDIGNLPANAVSGGTNLSPGSQIPYFGNMIVCSWSGFNGWVFRNECMIRDNNGNYFPGNSTVLTGTLLSPPSPPSDATLTPISGNNQSQYMLPTTQAPSTGEIAALFGPLQAALKDASGKPLAGMQVVWTCIQPMTCAMDPTGKNYATGVTDSNGMATLNALGGNSLLTTIGPDSLLVCASAGYAVASFNVKVNPPPTMSVYAGNNQVAVLPTTPGSTPSFSPISVKFTDAAGNPVPNFPVNFTCAGCGFNGSAMSGTNGIAIMNFTASRLLTIPGDFTVTASSPAANPVSVTFNLALQPPPPGITLSGNNQSLLLTGSTPPGGIANFAPLTATVTDGYGNPIVCAPGSASGCAQVTWTCIHPGAMICQIDPTSTTAPSTTTTTDSAGKTTLNKINGASVSAYQATGPITVTAAYGTVASATFHLTVATPPPTAALNVISGNAQTVTRVNGTATFAPLGVFLMSPTYQPIPGQTVTFVCSAPSGLTCRPAMSSTTTAGRSGTAAFSGLQVSGTGAGGVVTVTAMAPGASSAIFQLTVK